MKAVIDSNIPYIRGLLEPHADVIYRKGTEIIADDIADADALLIRTRTVCDSGLLRNTNVKFIGTSTIGYDHIDVEWCAANGIKVASSAGCNAGGVLQWIAAALALLSEKEGWKPEEKTLGIVGVGHVGTLVRNYGKIWGFNVICSDPPREKAEGLERGEGFFPFTEIAERADIVTFHVPLSYTGEYRTHNIGNSDFFSRLREGTTVINTSRGGVIGKQELVRAVKAGKCSCCIDTWHGEPYPSTELLDLAFIATPHIAGYSIQGKANASAMIIKELAQHFSLPFSDWYPPEVDPVSRRQVSWDEMCANIKRYCNLEQETAQFKENPLGMEHMRDTYRLREEFF